MKVNRVTETSRIPDQDVRSRANPDGNRRFFIDPLLESSGNPNADEEEHAQQDCETSVWVQPPNQLCYQTLPQPFLNQGEDTGPRPVATADSLREFLERVRNAYRLNLRF